MKRIVPTFTSIEPFIEAYTLYWIGLRFSPSTVIWPRIGLRFSPSTAIWPRIHPYSYSRPEKIDWKWGKCDLNTGPQIHITKRLQTTGIMHHVCLVPQRTNYIHSFCFFWFNQNHRFLTKKPNPIRLAVWLTGTENREIELSVRFSVRFCTGWGSAEQVSRIYGKDLKCWHAYFCGLAEQVSACRLESKMKSSN